MATSVKWGDHHEAETAGITCVFTTIYQICATSKYTAETGIVHYKYIFMVWEYIKRRFVFLNILQHSNSMVFVPIKQ